MNKQVNLKDAEAISALIDSELSEEELLSLLDGDQNSMRASWDVYHQIGDALRSDELAFQLSPEFEKKLHEQIEKEPHYLLSLNKPTLPAEQNWVNWGGLAAMVALAVLVMPFLIKAPLTDETSHIANAGSANTVSYGYGSNVAAVSVSVDDEQQTNQKDQNPKYELLRDPKLDSYLTAHQRYSPQLNLSAATHKKIDK